MTQSSSSNLRLFDSKRSGSSSTGCILSVLRRILRSTSIPSTSSCSAAARAEAEVVDDDKMMMEVVDDKAAVPGLVARLMGLESIPERRITRSRSLNSVDQIKPQEDDQQKKQLLHRRSKSTLSYRDTPTYITLDDDEFIILKFDNKPTRKKSRRNKERRRNREKTSDEKEQKQIRLVEKNQISSDTDDSSPVSIFDFQEPTSCSAEDDSWTRSSSSSSRASSPEQDKTKISLEQEDDHQNTDESVKSRHKAALLNNKTVVAIVNGQKKNREMWGRVCDVTVAEIKGTADWSVKDLAAEFEVHIMDQLLNDLLHLHSI